MHDTEKRLQLYLKSLASNGGSDLHIKSGTIVRIRVSGDLQKLGKEVMTTKDIDTIGLVPIRMQGDIRERYSDIYKTLTVKEDRKARFRANSWLRLTTDKYKCNHIEDGSYF